MEAPDLEIKVYKTVLGSVLSLPVLGIRGWAMDAAPGLEVMLGAWAGVHSQFLGCLGVTVA